MLRHLKAVIIGFIAIIILGLMNQLIYIMASVGFNALIKSNPELADWNQAFNYTFLGISYFIVMFCAGYITAIVSKHGNVNGIKTSNKTTYINTSIAAFLGMIFSLYTSLQQEIFTIFALFFILFGLFSALFGCYRRVKK